MRGLGHAESAPGDKGKPVRTSPAVLGLLCSRNQVEPLNKSISQAYWVTTQAALQAGTRCQAGLQVGLDGDTNTFPSAVDNPAWSSPPAPETCSFTTRCFPAVCSCLWYCPSLHLPAVFSWAQLQLPHSGVLLMLDPRTPWPHPTGYSGNSPRLLPSKQLHHRARAQSDQTPPKPGPRLISQSRYSNFKDLIRISLSSTWHWYNPAPFNGTWLLLALSVLINNQ